MTALIDLYSTDHPSLVSWICRTYGLLSGENQYQNPHRMRRETIARRLRLYRDQSIPDVEEAINQIYETDDYKTTLKRYVFAAREQNVTRRIIDEIASLYDKPVLRILKDAAQSDRLRAEEKRLHLHEIMQEAHHLLTLCNDALIWKYTGADDEAKLQIVTSDMFDAIPHPRDPYVPAGILIDVLPRTVLQGDARDQLPHYELWDDTYRYLISKQGRLVEPDGQPLLGAPIQHGLKRIPGVLLHRREPTTCILDASYGADIESAHLGVALLNIMILRLSKSQGENQPILQGNLAGMATGQVMNGEKPLLLPPEVVASMLGMKTDPDHYLAVKKDKLSSVCQSYGMSYEMFSNSESGDSGKLFVMRRQKLTEIRLESRRRAVMNEGEVLELIGFDSDGARYDFQEQAVPADASEELALLKDRIKLGLDSPIGYLMRKDPDLTRLDCLAMLKRNVEDFAMVMVLIRALNIPMSGDVGDPGKSPQENGADNQPKVDETKTEDQTDSSGEDPTDL